MAYWSMQPWPFLCSKAFVCQLISMLRTEKHKWHHGAALAEMPASTGDQVRGYLYIREDESIPVQPVGVLRVELHELVKEDVGNGSHAPGLESAYPVLRSELRGRKDGVKTYIGAPGWPDLLLAVASACKQKTSMIHATDANKSHS